MKNVFDKEQHSCIEKQRFPLLSPHTIPDTAEYALSLGIGGGFTSKVFSIFKESHKLYINLHFLWSVLMIKTHSSQADPVETPYRPLRWQLEETGSPHRRGSYLCQLLPGRKMLAAYFRSFRGGGPSLKLVNSPAAILPADVIHLESSSWLTFHSISQGLPLAHFHPTSKTALL